MRRHLARFLLCFALLSTLGAHAAFAQVVAPPDFERWFAVELRGEKAGHAMSSQVTSEDGTITTTNFTKFSIARGGMSVEMTMREVFVENGAGELVSAEFEQNLSTGTSVTSKYVWRDGGIFKEVVHAGEPSLGRIPPIEMDYLTPVETREHVVAQIDAGKTEIKYVTLDLMSGLKPMQTVVTVEGPATVDAYGRESVALKTTAVSSNMPGIRVTRLLDEQGLALYEELKLGAIPMRMVAMTKDEALKASEGADPELFTPTLVKVDPPIEAPRTVTGASYVLDVSEGTLPDMLDGGAFSFERLSPTSGRVLVDLSSPRQAANEDVSDPRFTRATTYANSEDVLLIRMAEAALKGTPPDRTARAQKLREFVYKFVTSKNLGTGFATASEVCRTAEGDCTEHAVLLAALLRVERIPSRVVSGLIYADAFAGQESVFGYHMWTQALLIVDGKPTWVDLDAVLPAGLTMDAAHIAVQTYDLSEEGFIASMTPVVSLLGTLSVEVESVTRE